MIDLRFDGAWGLDTLMFQRGGQFFDPQGNVAFATEDNAELIRWYILQTRGPEEDRVRLRLGAAGRQGDDRRAGGVPVDARLAQLGVPGRGAVAEGQDGVDADARLEAGRAPHVGVGRHRPHHHEADEEPGAGLGAGEVPLLRHAGAGEALPGDQHPSGAQGRLEPARVRSPEPVLVEPADRQDVRGAGARDAARLFEPGRRAGAHQAGPGLLAVGRALHEIRRGGADGGDPREPGRGRCRRAPLRGPRAQAAGRSEDEGAARRTRRSSTRARRRICSCRRTCC